jgi:hypothetical protein
MSNVRLVVWWSYLFLSFFFFKVSHNDSGALLKAALLAHRDRTRLASQGQGKKIHQEEKRRFS